jgi:hypothetical protein
MWDQVCKVSLEATTKAEKAATHFTSSLQHHQAPTKQRDPSQSQSRASRLPSFKCIILASIVHRSFKKVKMENKSSVFARWRTFRQQRGKQRGRNMPPSPKLEALSLSETPYLYVFNISLMLSYLLRDNGWMWAVTETQWTESRLECFWKRFRNEIKSSRAQGHDKIAVV